MDDPAAEKSKGLYSNGYEAVKPRSIAMKAEAKHGVDVAHHPRIVGFDWPQSYIYVMPVLLPLFYAMLAPDDGGPFWQPGVQLRALVGGASVVWNFFLFCYVCHTAQAPYAYWLCRRHRTGFVVGAGYVICTLAFGFPGWLDLRRRIKAARLQSVMKENSPRGV